MSTIMPPRYKPETTSVKDLANKASSAIGVSVHEHAEGLQDGVIIETVEVTRGGSRTHYIFPQAQA